MTERRATYRASPSAPVKPTATYKLFNRFHSDEAIREYMRERYGVIDVEVTFTGGGKLAGPVQETKEGEICEKRAGPVEESRDVAP